MSLANGDRRNRWAPRAGLDGRGDRRRVEEHLRDGGWCVCGICKALAAFKITGRRIPAGSLPRRSPPASIRKHLLARPPEQYAPRRPFPDLPGAIEAGSAVNHLSVTDTISGRDNRLSVRASSPE